MKRELDGKPFQWEAERAAEPWECLILTFDREQQVAVELGYVPGSILMRRRTATTALTPDIGKQLVALRSTFASA